MAPGLIALLLALQVPTTAEAPAPKPPPPRIFSGDQIGMDQGRWRTTSPEALAAVCTTSGEDSVCRLPDQSIGAGWSARDLTDRFHGGRLEAIEFRTSIDAFPYAVAILERDFGPAVQTVRDQIRTEGGERLPHVLMIYAKGDRSASLSDPLADGRDLSVRMQAGPPPRVGAAPSAAPAKGKRPKRRR